MGFRKKDFWKEWGRYPYNCWLLLRGKSSFQGATGCHPSTVAPQKLTACGVFWSEGNLSVLYLINLGSTEAAQLDTRAPKKGPTFTPPQFSFNSRSPKKSYTTWIKVQVNEAQKVNQTGDVQGYVCLMGLGDIQSGSCYAGSVKMLESMMLKHRSKQIVVKV